VVIASLHRWRIFMARWSSDHDVLMLYDVPENGMSDLGTVNIEPRH
jgi:hypothetical protein